MIAKQADPLRPTNDPRLLAGRKAEQQMAFYLSRAYTNTNVLLVFNDLRLVDPAQPNPDGTPGVCQIDHLCLFPNGAFIIESKSVTGRVAVRDDGTGGDEWTRFHDGKPSGMPSPIQQARRQGEFLRNLLNRHREQIRGKIRGILAPIARLTAKTDRKGFRNMPIQVIVAISDQGRIERLDGWEPQAKPHRTFLTKADLVTDKINAEIRAHVHAAKLLSSTPDFPNYGAWQIEPDELQNTTRFLLQRHIPRGTTTPKPAPNTTPPTTPIPKPAEQSTKPTCKHCGSLDLIAGHGKYGYFWKCAECDRNTSMPCVCSKCNTNGKSTKTVTIHKRGDTYTRACKHCGHKERIWVQRGLPASARR